MSQEMITTAKQRYRFNKSISEQKHFYLTFLMYEYIMIYVHSILNSM